MTASTAAPPRWTGGRVLRRTVTRNARRLSMGTGLISLHQVCESLVPIFIGVIIDQAIEPGDPYALALWIAGLALLFTTLTMMYRFGARHLMRAIAEEAHLLRLEVAGKAADPRGMRTDLRTGDLLTIGGSDADNTSYLLDYVPRIAGAVTATTVSAVALIVIDVPLGLVVLVGTPLVLLALQLGTPGITKRVAEQQEFAGKATSLATDLVSGMRPLRGIGAEDAAARRYHAVSRESMLAMIRAARAQGTYLAAGTAGGALLACGIAILAGWFALNGRISIGEFITVIGLAQFLMEPMGLLAIVPSWIAEARASADRVAAVISADPLLPEGTETPDTPGGQAPRLVLRSVRYGTLDGVDLTANPGEFVGIVAHRASDGEALVRILSGQVAPDDYTGEVLVGDAALRRAHHARLRETLLVEPHHTDLFSGTIRANIVAGLPEGHDKPDAWESLTDGLGGGPARRAGHAIGAETGGNGKLDLIDSAGGASTSRNGHGGDARPGTADASGDTHLADVLAASAADQVLSAHPEGIEHVIAERGAGLSGGQRQRVALARALLARPPILVLHDPTTAVDSVTEHTIARGIRALRHTAGVGDAPYTTVVVTSSPAMLALAERVIVLDGGRVIAEGRHDELVATNEDYQQAVLR
ncbi:ABC transporter ATP-binding protein [Thermopolyspora sp. NPDC052614]|uniref:ABC transporter ATP-binding protein n=1 Tax=Thermopolyspora sp. NPDC052614 TaxID=3155682 RepID=UPI003436D829